MNMQRIIREQWLSPEEAAEDQVVREQIAAELPDLIAGHLEGREGFEMAGTSGERRSIPSVSVRYAHNGSSTTANAMGMRPMQERVWQKRGEQYLLIKSPPASGKSRALMFVALDKIVNQKLKQAIIVVPERSIGASFHDEPLSQSGFWADWRVEPRWNLCDAPGADGNGKVDAVKRFVESADQALVCTHATFRFAMERFGAAAFDDRLIAVDEFHHISANPNNKLGDQVRQLMARDRTHLVAMTGSYFRGDAEAVLHPEDEAKFETVTYTYYEQLNGYQYLKQLDIGYVFYAGGLYRQNHRRCSTRRKKPSSTSRTLTHGRAPRTRSSEVEHIIEELGEWQGSDPADWLPVGENRPTVTILKVADLVDDDADQARKASRAALRDPGGEVQSRPMWTSSSRLAWRRRAFDWIWCEHALTVGYRSSLTEIVQIIGRATRDAPGKTRARFTNLIAEPDASPRAPSRRP